MDREKEMIFRFQLSAPEYGMRNFSVTCKDQPMFNILISEQEALQFYYLGLPVYEKRLKELRELQTQQTDELVQQAKPSKEADEMTEDPYHHTLTPSQDKRFSGELMLRDQLVRPSTCKICKTPLNAFTVVGMDWEYEQGKKLIHRLHAESKCPKCKLINTVTMEDTPYE